MYNVHNCKEFKAYKPIHYDHRCLMFNNIFLLDINECESSPCHPNATCTNAPGSFVCECVLGFSGNGSTCIGMFFNSVCFNAIPSTSMLYM